MQKKKMHKMRNLHKLQKKQKNAPTSYNCVLDHNIRAHSKLLPTCSLAEAVATRGDKAFSAPDSETPDDSQQAAAACANALQKDDPLIQSVGIQEIRWQ